jgi:hypothetical protein
MSPEASFFKKGGYGRNFAPMLCTAGLPNGLFSNQKLPIWVNF